MSFFLFCAKISVGIITRREVEEKLFSLKKAAHLPHRRAGGGEHLLGAARGVLPSAESVGKLLLDLGGGGAGRGRLALLLGALVVVVIVFRARAVRDDRGRRGLVLDDQRDAGVLVVVRDDLGELREVPAVPAEESRFGRFFCEEGKNEHFFPLGLFFSSLFLSLSLSLSVSFS